tara:strand:+ start:1199 stop:3019 length:1821 start_codon:yes stop_codon:yes gene_type:complete
MADLVSPGILIKETDLTTTVPPIGGSSAGIVIAAEWGPAEEAITVTSETDLVEVFGKPLKGASDNWLVAANYLSYASNLQVGRSVDSSDRNATSSGTGVAVKNTSHFNSLSITSDSWIARYPGIKGNEIGVALLTSGSTVAGSEAYLNKTTGASAASSSADTVTITFGNEFDYMPQHTAYVEARGGSHDEVHVAVFDKRGTITGVQGTILEKFTGLSLANDAKDSFGASNYIKDVLYNKSKWIYFTGDWTELLTDADVGNWEGGTSTTSFTAYDENVTDENPTGTDAGFRVEILGGGVGSTDANTAANRKAIYTLLWEDKETTDVSFLIGGVGENSATASADGVASTISTIVKSRKDCIGFVSPPKLTDTKDITSPTETVSTKATEIADWQDLNTSYMVVDSGWKKVYNRYTDTYESIPLNGDTAGLTALTEQTNDSWWSPAGYNRGNVRNVYELYFNPDQAARDKLYKAGVNPVVSFPGQGVVLFGDKTSQSKPSAFDRINVRRLFIHIEKAVSAAAKSMLFEFNDEFTRSEFRNMVEPFLRDVKARRGVYDYKVVCDTSNNTSAVIDRNEFVGDIYIKPARSINYIRLNFVAVRSGVDFSEVVG